MAQKSVAQMTKRERFNIAVSCLRGTFIATAKLFFTGTVIQTFLAYYGVSSELIGIYTTLMSVSDILTTVLFSDIAEKYGKLRKAVMLLGGGMAVSFLPLLILCLFSGVPAGLAFGLSLAVGIIQSSMLAMWNIFNYKLPFLCFHISFYGYYCSMETAIGSLTSIGAGVLLSWFVQRMEYTRVMFFGFLFAAVSFLITVFLNRLLRLEGEEKAAVKVQKKSSPLRALGMLLKLPLFTHLILPSFFRGMAAGILGMSAVIAMKMGFDEADTSVMVTVCSVASILGALVFNLISRKADTRNICLFSGFLVAFFPVIGFGGKTLFYVMYFIAMLGKIMVDLSVPTMLFPYIPYEISGEYNAWRLMLATAGIAVASLLTGFFTDFVPAVWIAAAAGGFQVLSGFLYRFAPALKKENIIN